MAYHAARGYYEVQDGLRTRFPHLILENCLNGGNLVDYGVVRRTDYVCITDVYDPLSNRQAFFDSSYALPAAICECYRVIVSSSEPESAELVFLTRQ